MSHSYFKNLVGFLLDLGNMKQKFSNLDILSFIIFPLPALQHGSGYNSQSGWKLSQKVVFPWVCVDACWMCIFDHVFHLHPKSKWNNFFPSTSFGCLQFTLDFFTTQWSMVAWSIFSKTWKFEGCSYE
jgi:hypothetical protein